MHDDLPWNRPNTTYPHRKDTISPWVLSASTFIPGSTFSESIRATADSVAAWRQKSS